MIEVPTVGFQRSVNVHNVELAALCDWIEASVLFGDDPSIPAGDVVECLCDSEVYEQQAFAWEMVLNAWTEMSRRKLWLGGGLPFTVSARRLQRSRRWTSSPGYAFCLLLSMAKWCPNWAHHFGNDYTEQGELFELLTEHALRSLFDGWAFHRTGWSRTQAIKLDEVVLEVASHLGEPRGELRPWTEASANEAGLDIVCHRAFPDTRPGIPVYLMQCGSGKEYNHKLHTPELRIWTRIVNFTCEPKKAFALPFALLDDEFKRVCNIVNGMVLDRCRLMSCPVPEQDWLPAQVRRRLVAWCRPRIARLSWEA